MEILKIREQGEITGKAAAWFHAKWGVPTETYRESIEECLNNSSAVPQWYLAVQNGEIVAGCGVFSVSRSVKVS